MKGIIANIMLFFLRLYVRLRGKHLMNKYVQEEPPLRSELFSSVQMLGHGATLAGSHKLSDERPSKLLLTRLTENEDILVETYTSNIKRTFAGIGINGCDRRCRSGNRGTRQHGF